MTAARAYAKDSPVFIGDDLALDFINSRYGVGDARLDHLTDAAKVHAWLHAAGLPGVASSVQADSRLLPLALSLREHALACVQARITGEVGDTRVLNEVLAAGRSYEALVWPAHGEPMLQRHERAEGAEAVLLPVAQAIAHLLAHGDPTLIRQCESDDCTLWFYDRTKSHHRRWCSQAVCGNRMKVAAFRARKSAQSK